MIDMLNIIKPGIGLGNLKFGILREELKEILGEPNRIDRFLFQPDIEDWAETWEYDNLGLYIGFEEQDNWKLSLFTITSKIFEFEGQKLIGLSKQELKSLLNGINVIDLKYEDYHLEEAPSHELISSDSLGMNFWFDDDKVSEVQWGPLFSDPNTIIWPE